MKLRFIDSYKFLTSSLDKLASFWSKNKLKILQSQFQNLSSENFNLLTRKGVFPYEYIDCVNKLNDVSLPSRESFYSSLTGNTISDSDYAHAENIWKRFSIGTLGEYSDLYLKIDVLLLADIFENFRDKCIESYGLDPAYYYTLPGYTWDVMLKYTNVTFELLTDIDRVAFTWTPFNWTRCNSTRCNWTQYIGHGSIAHRSITHRSIRHRSITHCSIGHQRCTLFDCTPFDYPPFDSTPFNYTLFDWTPKMHIV